MAIPSHRQNPTNSGYKTTQHPMPHGMVGISLWEWRLRRPGEHHRRDPRLGPTFGIPPTRNQQMEPPSFASVGRIAHHGQGRSGASRRLTPSSAIRQTAPPGYASAMTMSRHGQGRSEKSRSQGSSSRDPNYGSKHGAADVTKYEPDNGECQEFDLADGCGQWDPTCGMQTASKVQIEMPTATKRMMKEKGICVQGFKWTRQIYNGWRCEGGYHFVLDDQKAADNFLRDWLPRLISEMVTDSGDTEDWESYADRMGIDDWKEDALPNGMVGITVQIPTFRLQPIGAFGAGYGMRNPRLQPTFGIRIPPSNRQAAFSGFAEADRVNSRGQGHSAGSRAQAQLPRGGRQTAFPGYDVAISTDRPGQAAKAMSRGSHGRFRTQGASSPYQKRGAADLLKDELDNDECQRYEPGDGCGQWDTSCGMKTVTKEVEPKEMPIATKWMLIKSSKTPTTRLFSCLEHSASIMGIPFSKRSKRTKADAFRRKLEEHNQIPPQYTFDSLPNGMVGLKLHLDSMGVTDAVVRYQMRVVSSNPGVRVGPGPFLWQRHHQRTGYGIGAMNHNLGEGLNMGRRTPLSYGLPTHDQPKREWRPTCGDEATRGCGAEDVGDMEKDPKTQEMLKATGLCPEGFIWCRQEYHGWRCGGGTHWVFDNQQAADNFMSRNFYKEHPPPSDLQFDSSRPTPTQCLPESTFCHFIASDQLIALKLAIDIALIMGSSFSKSKNYDDDAEDEDWSRPTFYILPNGMVSLSPPTKLLGNTRALKRQLLRVAKGSSSLSSAGVRTIQFERHTKDQKRISDNRSMNGTAGILRERGQQAFPSRQTLASHQPRRQQELPAECMQTNLTCSDNYMGDKKEQEIKTQKMLKATGVCPVGYGWVRWDLDHGWRCTGGTHTLFDDQQAAEAYVNKHMRSWPGVIWQ
ncbi:MAG: hypothetical protein Q9169_006251 [Polycauliona sp. 2 TL-2023]